MRAFRLISYSVPKNKNLNPPNLLNFLCAFKIFKTGILHRKIRDNYPKLVN